MRVSGGHLCGAEAPTEPAGETAVRCAAIRSLPPPSLRSRADGCGNPFSFEGNTDSFTLRVQNDRNLVIAKVRVSGGHLCGAEAPTEPAGETQNGCGNPFFFEGNTDSFTLRVQNDRNLVIAKVRVSGGHLCGAEAPTEPAGETQTAAAIRSP